MQEEQGLEFEPCRIAYIISAVETGEYTFDSLINALQVKLMKQEPSFIAHSQNKWAAFLTIHLIITNLSQPSLIFSMKAYANHA